MTYYRPLVVYCGLNSYHLVSSTLHDFLLVHHWVRPTSGVPFTPKRGRSLRTVIISILLLLSGNIELNPGPPISPVRDQTAINFGCWNIRSAANRSKATLLHDTIAEHQIEIIAITETWINESAPAAIKNDIAPPGFQALHVHRAGEGRGGGLAIVYRSNLPVINHPLQKQVKPVTFELQLVKLGLTTLANIYRPPSGSVNQFLDEFSDLLALLYSQTAGKVVICGDFNCRDFYDELSDGLESFGLIQHVQEGTRGENLLDLPLQTLLLR